jgi:hypothetical protein
MASSLPGFIANLTLQQLGIVSVTASVGYLTIVRFFRWRRYNALHREFDGKMETMTPKEAQEIMAMSYLYDMPGLLNYALSFALFKTYAIVGIADFRSTQRRC